MKRPGGERKRFGSSNFGRVYYIVVDRWRYLKILISSARVCVCVESEKNDFESQHSNYPSQYSVSTVLLFSTLRGRGRGYGGGIVEEVLRAGFKEKKKAR